MSQMLAVLSELPDDLRLPATRLWKRAERVTHEVTETLMYSYKVLGAVPGRPELLQDGSDMLRNDVAEELAEVVADLDQCHPEVSNAWQGQGSESFNRYMPRLTGTIADLQQSAMDTATAVSAFQDSLVLLWGRLLSRVERTADQVRLAAAAAGSDHQQAAISVIDIVEEFAGYVEELADSLMNLRSDSHPAGLTLAQAAEPITGLVEDAQGARLPKPEDGVAEMSDWQPAHTNVWLDTRAMAGLTAALSDSGQYWRAAAQSGVVVQERFGPEAFGLAGADFQPRVQAVLERDVSAYRSADRHLEELANTLRQIGHQWVVADDAVSEELGRGLEDE